MGSVSTYEVISSRVLDLDLPTLEILTKSKVEEGYRLVLQVAIEDQEAIEDLLGSHADVVRWGSYHGSASTR